METVADPGSGSALQRMRIHSTGWILQWSVVLLLLTMACSILLSMVPCPAPDPLKQKKQTVSTSHVFFFTRCQQAFKLKRPLLVIYVCECVCDTTGHVTRYSNIGIRTAGQHISKYLRATKPCSPYFTVGNKMFSFIIWTNYRKDYVDCGIGQIWMGTYY